MNTSWKWKLVCWTFTQDIPASIEHMICSKETPNHKHTHVLPVFSQHHKSFMSEFEMCLYYTYAFIYLSTITHRDSLPALVSTIVSDTWWHRCWFNKWLHFSTSLNARMVKPCKKMSLWLFIQHINWILHFS